MLLCNICGAQHYYIQGNINIAQGANGFEYTLTNITNQGISFAPATSITGQKNDEGYIEYTFYNADAGDCSFDTGFDFYKRTDGKWQKDVERVDAKMNRTSSKDMCVMLVIDCSSSMGNSDFVKAKNSAIRFINIMNEKSQGGVHIGIIGFNSMRYADQHIYEMEQLDNTSRYKMINFINSLTIAGQTALYYSMDKAINHMKHYASQLNTGRGYDQSVMLVFTDGFDQGSIDEKIGLPGDGESNAYFQHVRNRVETTTINNKPLTTYMCIVPGVDVRGSDSFERLMRKLASPGCFRLIDNFDLLEQEFEAIAQQLVKRWQNLILRVAPGHTGEVKWVLGCDLKVEEPEPEPVSENSLFVGACAELGVAYDIGVMGGLDVLYPISDRFSVGGYAQLGFDVNGGVPLGIGPMVGWQFNRGTRLFMGMGLYFYDGYFGFSYLRYGYKFRNRYYLSALLGNIRYDPVILVGFGITLKGNK